MKRKYLIASALIVLCGIIGYAIPIAVASLNARPLYGNFDMSSKCMGGHEIFLCLEEDKAYQNCPGHRSKDPIGRVERTAHSATIYWEDSDDIWCRVDLEGSTHTLVVISNSSPSRHPLSHVNNPWRIWLPHFLPEH